MQSMAPERLLKEARKTMQSRAVITGKSCDKLILLLESLIKYCSCTKTKIARIVSEGTENIRGELDIHNYLTKMRLASATLDSLTTFN